MVVGGALPLQGSLLLETIDPLRADYFLQRREMCVWNISGGVGIVTVGSSAFALQNKSCLYIGMGNQDVSFTSQDSSNPTHFYLLSTLAYTAFPTKLLNLADIVSTTVGSQETCSLRQLYKFVIPGVCQSSQICCGMTIIQSNNVWNTMPCHTHARRTEAYLYFDMPAKSSSGAGNRICHVMGPPQQTRCMWVSPEEAIIATPGYVHFGCGTQNYAFIWCMAGENPFDFNDMDAIDPSQLM
eukprot:c4272_g1_i1.p1 GENE.c4272_g1_i1~~c4272_g1_i1.p1  ORF type:complete len:241 (+),score=34.73 c4272_g1_i1:105-827(+)